MSNHDDRYTALLQQRKALQEQLENAPKEERRAALIALSRNTEELTELKETMGKGTQSPRRNLEGEAGQMWRRATWQDNEGRSWNNGDGTPLRWAELEFLAEPQTAPTDSMTAALRLAIDALPTTRRDYLLAHLSGQSVTAIAETMGVNKSTVSRTLTRAKAQLTEEATRIHQGRELMEDFTHRGVLQINAIDERTMRTLLKNARG